MLHNGVLVHLNQEIYGNTPHAGLASYAGVKPRGPLALRHHHCPHRMLPDAHSAAIRIAAIS